MAQIRITLQTGFLGRMLYRLYVAVITLNLLGISEAYFGNVHHFVGIRFLSLSGKNVFPRLTSSNNPIQGFVGESTASEWP